MSYKKIIEENLNEIKDDLKEIPGILSIDFIDIFPISENHKKMLDDELQKESNLICKTERGNVYKLLKPLNTIYGKLDLIKIRFFDESRLNWSAAADFVIKNRDIIKNKVGMDKRFSYIERPQWDAVEFKTERTLVYFLSPLASEVYLKNNTSA